ncbi:hypothetical protein CEP48_00390 [Mergibacter septicus]|uniref:Uncharacterized protein n=1 Tax=Mergibacter septicus TaxID=221402 RepID=A0A8E3MEL4_9PAST|nr:site-specific integrase [Mergibacter septicus]AWX14739.1 hypothetical protein CEP47_00390 [Mergibacter septicus]QDJ13990.1 hypothetical protein CEP48_00390 [Mergibacter septicus]UTU48561.1 site-specific integrase [Mergibacter septicus]WMR95810.1 site-specific integrase [Mergibacter septicus]
MGNNHITFRELLDKYCHYKYLRPETETCYKKAVNQLLKYSSETILVSEITLELVIQWRTELVKRIKPVTFNNYLRHCRALMYFAIKYKFVDRIDNPFSGVSLREGKRAKKIINDQDLTKLEYILDREILQPAWFIRSLIITFQCTGLRSSQLLQLKICNIDIKNRTIFISSDINKNHNDHIIPISNRLLPHINEILIQHQKLRSNKHEQLFNINKFSATVYRKNQDMNRNQLGYIFKQLSKLCKTKISPHRFRHTVATNLMRDPEKNLYITQKLLGHNSIKTTLGYIDHNVEMLRNCVEKL